MAATQLSLFEDPKAKETKRNIPFAPARVLIAVVSALIGALGLKVTGLHWGAFEPSFRFGLAEVALAALAILVIVSGTFASSGMLRMFAYLVAIVAGAVLGASTWIGRLVVGGVMIVAGLALPILWRGLLRLLRAARRRFGPPPSGPTGPAQAAGSPGTSAGSPGSGSTPPTQPPNKSKFRSAPVRLGLVVIAAGAAITGLPPLALGAAFQAPECGMAAELEVRYRLGDGPERSMDITDEVHIELDGGRAHYRFFADTTRQGEVAVWFDGFEPLDFSGDVLGWADTFGGSDVAEYEIEITRSGLLGTYEVHFRDGDGETDRSPIGIVPGRSKIRSDFVFRDGAAASRCSISLDVMLEPEPWTTLPGLASLFVTTGAATSISPTRRRRFMGPPDAALAGSVAGTGSIAATDQAAEQADVAESDAADSKTTEGVEIIASEVTVDGQIVEDGKAAIATGEKADIEVRLTAKLDTDEDELAELQEADVSVISRSELVSLLRLKPTIDIKGHEVVAKLTAVVVAGDKPGAGVVELGIEMGGVEEVRKVEITVGGEDVIDIRAIDDKAKQKAGDTSASPSIGPDGKAT